MTQLPLADQLSALARELQGQQDLAATLRAIVDASLGTVPGPEHASITTISSRRLVATPAATSVLARAADLAQYESGEGPCLDALYDKQTVQIPDLASDLRWPAFAERARALGVRSMICLQLFVTGDELGALNLYSESAEAFSEESEHVALLFASHAAVAMAGAQSRHQHGQAMVTRDLIGQAKGILMERYKIDGDSAFTLLVTASQRSNVKLNEIALQLTETGDLTTSRPGATR